jgi:hypothetical protein
VAEPAARPGLGSNDGCELFERNGSHATLCAEQKARVGETTLF